MYVYKLRAPQSPTMQSIAMPTILVQRSPYPQYMMLLLCICYDPIPNAAGITLTAVIVCVILLLVVVAIVAAIVIAVVVFRRKHSKYRYVPHHTTTLCT